MLGRLLKRFWQRRPGPWDEVFRTGWTGSRQLLELAVLGTRLSRALQLGRQRQAAKALHRLHDLWQQFAEETPATVVATATEAPTQFLVDALFLRRSYDFLFRRRAGKPHVNPNFKEVFHYATGMRVDPTCFVIGHIVEVRFADHGVGHVHVANDSNAAALAAMDELGLPLVCHVHSHPGTGIPMPSETDFHFQGLLEKGRHICIGAVFSVSGFVRFYASDAQRFTVHVHGKKIEEVEPNVYRIPVAHDPLSVVV